MCYSVFEKTFSYLSWLSLLLILESLILDSWNQLSSWILKCSWFYLEHLELILWLTFELFVITFVIIFVIIKTSLNQSWFIMKLCFYNLNWTKASVFNFERLNILCAWIGHPSETLWPFEFLENFCCSISSVSMIYHGPQSYTNIKSNGHLNWTRASVFNFERLDI